MKRFSFSNLSSAACVNSVNRPGCAPGASSSALILLISTTSTPATFFAALRASHFCDTTNNGPIALLKRRPLVLPFPARTCLRSPRLRSSCKPMLSNAVCMSLVLLTFSKSLDKMNGYVAGILCPLPVTVSLSMVAESALLMAALRSLVLIFVEKSRGIGGCARRPRCVRGRCR